jgi:hypothetical protein
MGVVMLSEREQYCHQHVQYRFTVSIVPPSAATAGPRPLLSLHSPISHLSIHLTAMSPLTVSCIRCNDLGHECVLHHAVFLCRLKVVCNECEAAGLDRCLFPPSIRLHRRSKSACSSCMDRHQKCIFLDKNDRQ